MPQISKKKALENQIAELEAKLRLQSAEIGVLEADLDEAESKLVDLESDLSVAQEDNEAMRGQLNDYEWQEGKLESAISDLIETLPHTGRSCTPLYPMNPWDCPACAIAVEIKS